MADAQYGEGRAFNLHSAGTDLVEGSALAVKSSSGAIAVDGVSEGGNVALYVGGAVAHDAADAGNPIKIGGKAYSSTLPTTLVANADRSDASFTVDGVQAVASAPGLAKQIDYAISSTSNTAALPVGNVSQITLTATGSWTGTIILKGSWDGTTTWDSIRRLDTSGVDQGYAFTGNNQSFYYGLHRYSHVRLEATISSGTANIRLVLNTGPIVSMVASGDALSSDGHHFPPALSATRALATAPLMSIAYAMGDNIGNVLPFNARDGSDRLAGVGPYVFDGSNWDRQRSSPGGTGTQAVGGLTAADAAVAVAPVTVGGRASNAAPTAVSADGDVVDARFTRTGALNVYLVDQAGAGASIGGGTQYAEDAAFGGNGTGTLMIARRDDALSTLTPAADDAVGLRVGDKGALWVQISDGSGNQITSFGGGTQFAEDAALGSTPTGTLAMARRDDLLGALTPVADDAVSQRVNAVGALWTTAGAKVEASGSLTALNQAVTIDTTGADYVQFNFGSPNDLVGEVTVEGFVNGGWSQHIWTFVEETNSYSRANAWAPTEGYTAFVQAGAYAQVRLRVSAYTSGTVTVNAIAGRGRGIWDFASLVDPVAFTPQRVYDAGLTEPYTPSAGEGWAAVIAQSLVMGTDGLRGQRGDATGTWVQGAIARDTALTSAHKPVLAGARGSTAMPTAVSADGDILDLWASRNGILNVMLRNEAGDTIDDGIGALRVNISTVGVGTLPVGGDVAHDAADSGFPIKVGGRANAAAPTDVSANNDRVDAWFLRNGAQATVLTAAGALIGGDATNGLDVDITRLPASTNTIEVVGDVAQDAAVAGNPLLVGLRASTAVPTAMSADGDAVYGWANRSGAQVMTQAPHVGLNSDPWNLLHEGAQYTATQTSTALVSGGASEKIVVTSVQIQAFDTAAGDVIVYFGTGAYSRGTNRAIFDGTFKPSSTLAPGVVMNGPFISGANGDDILVTTTNNIDVTISIWYYVVT